MPTLFCPKPLFSVFIPASFLGFSAWACFQNDIASLMFSPSLEYQNLISGCAPLGRLGNVSRALPTPSWAALFCLAPETCPAGFTLQVRRLLSAFHLRPHLVISCLRSVVLEILCLEACLSTKNLTWNWPGICFLLLFSFCSFPVLVCLFWMFWLVQHSTQISMPPTGFEPAIPASEWLQTLALDFVRASFSFFPSVLFIFVCLYVLCPYVFCSSTTHNTNIHVPGGIQIRNTSRRSVAGSRFISLGHWHRTRASAAKG